MTIRKILGRASMTWAAGVALALMAWGGVEGNAKKFLRLPATGRCGLSVLTQPVSSLIMCATICATDPLCEGFSSSNISCEKVQNASLPDLNPAYGSFVTESVFQKLVNTTSNAAPTSVSTSTTHTSTTTTYTSTTTTPTPSTTTPTPTTTTSTPTTESSTTAGPVMVSSMPGVSGANIIGFTQNTDSFIGLISFDVFASPVSNPPPSVKSTVLSSSEACGANQAMVGIGGLQTGDQEKSDQRMYCADILSPYSITSNCNVVPLGQEPRPNVTGKDTSSWYSWLVCQDNYIITQFTWTYDTTAPFTPYRYSAAKCCLVQ